MDDETRARWIQALGVAAGIHEERRSELTARLADVSGDYDLQALDAAREAAYRYLVASSELRGFRWALRQALDEGEIIAMAREAGASWEEFVAMQNEKARPIMRQNEQNPEG